MSASLVTLLGAVSAVGVVILYVVFGSPWKFRTVRGFPGLLNIGNTCFVNALLQALAACPLFVAWVKHCVRNSSRCENRSLFATVSDVLTLLSSKASIADVVDPTAIVQALLDIGWVIPVTEEQDSHEFFHVLVSALCEDGHCKGLNMVTSAWPSLSLNHSSDGVLQERVRAGQASPFHGTLASCLIHTTSQRKLPIKYDGFDSISVSLPRDVGVVTIERCLHCYVQSEVVQLKSDEVPVPSPSAYFKRLRFGKLPKCLAIHVQRTYWHARGTPFKDNTHVQFPHKLDMAPFVHNKTKRKSLYQLKSVICHVGDVFSGHFITYRRLIVDSSATDHSVSSQWLYASDSTVRPALCQEVESAVAYMLFYEQVL